MLQEVAEKPYINVYVGTVDKEETWADILYVDLIVDGEEYTLENSEQDLEGLTNAEFLVEMERLLDFAKKLSKRLGLKVKLDIEGMLEQLGGDEADREDVRKMKNLLREFRENIQ